MSSDTERPEDSTPSDTADAESGAAQTRAAGAETAADNGATNSGPGGTEAAAADNAGAKPDADDTEAAGSESRDTGTGTEAQGAAADSTGEDTGTGAEATADSGSTLAGAAAGAERNDDSGDAPKYSPALIATAVALPVALIVAVLLIAVVSRQDTVREPLALGSVPAPAAGGPACAALLPALPDSLGDYTKAELAQPAPPATVAWQLPDGGEPIVLRCGLDRPLEFDKASALQVINGVNWFEVRDRTSGVTSGTWFVVDRGTYIAVTVADSAGPTPLQDISDTLTETLPARPIDPGPVPN
ncbi:hypothetical protein NWFMUON74_20690 [Nocardia wallacei]|uniref:DUF3515 domain-containing protein n=1 Tax=Nocardia wallacei TaxID=480035 RepID=A0A7G1KGG1_9NOCA|nr:DUF3515 domain-containing protein [Nocardia wallacei]BCK54297.1 hypothetical protein NWFMUON74_20690 [Nocardia wallacei]